MAGYINITDIIQNATATAWHNSDSAEFDSQVPPGLIVVLRIMLGFFFCLGVGGNVLTITSIAMTRSLHSVPNIYLCSLAASDLILCTIAMPSTFVGYTIRIPDELCSVLAEIIFTCITVSLMSITMVAVNRYVLVVKPSQYYLAIYTTRNVKISIATIWLLGVLYGTPPHFGFGEYVYNHKMGGCFVRAETMDSWLFTKIFGLGLSFLPAMLVSLYCYINIFITFRFVAHSRLRVFKVHFNLFTPNCYTARQRAELKSYATRDSYLNMCITLTPLMITNFNNQNVVLFVPFSFLLGRYLQQNVHVLFFIFCLIGDTYYYSAIQTFTRKTTIPPLL